jgi:hypothetical protein
MPPSMPPPLPPRNPPSSGPPFIASGGAPLASHFTVPSTSTPSATGSFGSTSMPLSTPSSHPSIQPLSDKYFLCEYCQRCRPKSCQVQPFNLCCYCTATQEDGDDGENLQWCTGRLSRPAHGAPHSDLVDEGGVEHSTCNDCRGERRPARTKASQTRRQRDTNRARFLEPSQPVLDLSAPDLDLNSTSLGHHDLQYLQSYFEDIESQQMETCNRCHRQWLGLRIRNGICDICHRRDAKKCPEDPCFYSAEISSTQVLCPMTCLSLPKSRRC